MTRRYRRQFRCMYRLERRSERKEHGGNAKCGKRVSCEPRKLGRCPKCGCDYMWADVTPDVARTNKRQRCSDARCPYLGGDGSVYPHSVYSRACVNNPWRDEFGMTDEPGRRETGTEPSW